MKKLLFTIALIFASLNLSAENFIYCELVGTAKFMSNKVRVQVDYGQETSFWQGIDYMKDKNGNKIEFNSMVDAMNYFGKQGWEFIQAYTVTMNNQNVYHWLLKKSVTAEEMKKVVTQSSTTSNAPSNNNNSSNSSSNSKEIPDALKKYMR